MNHLKEKKCWRDTPCIPFKGCISSKGYGVLTLRGRQWKAHVLAVLLDGRKYPKRHVTDHLCRNRACINPAHLRVCLNADNVLAGISFAATNKTKTHCPKGHEYSTANTVIRTPRGSKVGSPWRECRKCRNAYGLSYYYKRKEAQYAETR